MAHAQVLKARVKTETPRNGIATEDAKALASGLSRSLAETYVLYLKTQGFHWNVVGPLFYGLHKLTEEQYQDLAGAADELAERIRALGHPAPASFARFLELSSVKEVARPLSAEDMVAELVADHETVSSTFRELVEVADKARDVATADLLTERLHFHEQAAWMLRSIAAR